MGVSRPRDCARRVLGRLVARAVNSCGRRELKCTATTAWVLSAVLATGCALPGPRYWGLASGRTAQDFERDHRICYADAHRVTLDIIGPAQVDRAYVDCLTAPGRK